MRSIILLFILVTGTLVAQTFNRNYGKGYPWEEYTAATTQEVNGTYYSLYRQVKATGYQAFMVFQATDANGDTLFTSRLEDDLHPYATYGLEKSHLSTDLFGSGFKQTYSAVQHSRRYLVVSHVCQQ
jgi:hypothetical protein